MCTAERISELREYRGLNQKEFADNIGINRSVVNRIEMGTRPIRDDELKLIADYFGVSADYLLGRNVGTPVLSNEQKRLLGGFAKLSSDNKKLVFNLIWQLGTRSVKPTDKKTSKGVGVTDFANNNDGYIGSININR